MPFLFQWLCDLLEELDASRHRKVITAAHAQDYESQIVHAWYRRFTHKIERTGPSATAFLSCVLPERRPDRVYNLQAKRLSQVFGRALNLGVSRASELNQWHHRDGADFASCVELTLRNCENPRPTPDKEVTLEEIDEALELVAALSLSSSPAIRAKRSKASVTELLSPILRRLQSNEAKWFARMILKTYAPVQIPEYAALHGFHFMLPNLLKVQNSFDAAISTLTTEAIRQLPPRPDRTYEHALQSLVSRHVHPQLGVMVRRQPYDKARSIKHCCKMAREQQMSIERKYDGEYCQIHVDMSKRHGNIQIFSKSGRDSTHDRLRLHGTIKDALRIGNNGCAIRHCCIIEGELLVWSATKKQIQPFHKIRKYVKHGGRELGTARDSPLRSDEHLMIAFYDILVLDNRMLLNEPHTIRRRYLKQVLHTAEGRAILCERKIIDFGVDQANAKLREFFARAITKGWEGLVLKGSKSPYFSWTHQGQGIKLKKDYITGLGDTADLCVIGGRRDPQVELQIGLGYLDWTTFYLGAVRNMEAMRRFDEKPNIMVIDILTHHSMSKTDLLDFNRLGKLVRTAYAPVTDEFSVSMGRFDIDKPSDLFRTPFIVEIMGAGFERPSNSAFYTLRFPRKIGYGVKLHTDRTLLDTVSFPELQRIAEQSMNVVADVDSQEDAAWVQRLIEADGKRNTHQTSPQGGSPAKTPTSPSTMSLSSIDPNCTSPSRMVVRPDTEEPDTQSSSSRATGSPATCRKNGADIQETYNSNPATLYRTTTNLRKRKLSSAMVVEEKPPKRKRQPLQIRTSHQTTLNSYPSGKPQTSSSQGKTSEEQSDPDPENTDVFDKSEKTTHGVPSGPSSPVVAAGLDSNEHANSVCSPETPDSTLLMRQILCLQHISCAHTHDISPTKVVSNGSIGYTGIARHVDAQPHLLPTPPTSSPIITKTTSRQSKRTCLPQHGMDQEAQHTAQLTITTFVPSTKIIHNGQSEVSASKAHSGVGRSTPPLKHSPRRGQIARQPPVLLLRTSKSLCPGLADITAPFTYSLTYFFSYIDLTPSPVVTKSSTNTTTETTTHHPPQYPIILLDSLNPDLAAESLKAVATQVQTRLHPSEPYTEDFPSSRSSIEQFNDRVLVFDQRVLDHPSIVNGGETLNVEVLRRLDLRKGHGRDAALFCGVLRFRYAEVGRAKSDGERTRAGNGEETRKVEIALEYRFQWLKVSP